jgi:hypothetical protein
MDEKNRIEIRSLKQIRMTEIQNEFRLLGILDFEIVSNLDFVLGIFKLQTPHELPRMLHFIKSCRGHNLLDVDLL